MSQGDELGKKYCYEYPRPAVTVDAVMFDKALERILLIERKYDPGKGCWALPGGFIEMDEELEQSVSRELYEETGVAYAGPWLQVGAYGRVDRDPRTRVIMVAFTAKISPEDCLLKSGDDANDARWFDVNALPDLAFDHADVIVAAQKMLRY